VWNFTAYMAAQDVWPVASRMVDVYRGGGGVGGFGGYYSGLQHKGPSAPYLQFSAGGSKVHPACARTGVKRTALLPCLAVNSRKSVCTAQAKTDYEKRPGVETDWTEPVHVDAKGTHLRVSTLPHTPWAEPAMSTAETCRVPHPVLLARMVCYRA